MISGSEAHHESHYAPAPVQKEEDLPVVGKRHSLIAIGCLVVVLLCSAVALGSPDWISFSYKDLQYKVQNSRSVIPLLPHQSSVKLTAGLIRATVEWKHYPSSFSTCQGATQGLNSRQLISSGACGRVGVDVNSSCPDGSYSGGVDGAVDFICSLKFNYTSWTEELITQHLTDVHGKVDINKLNVSYLCDAPGNGGLKAGLGSVVATGTLCDADRLFFRVGYPGYSTVFLIFLDALFVIAALVMNILSMQPGHWRIQLRIGCCPLAKAGWVLSSVGFIFSLWPPFNFLMQSALEKGMPQVINEEGNNIQPVVPSDVDTTQGSDVSLTFGWGLFVYFPLAQIVLFLAMWFSRKAWQLHEEQYELNPDIFFSPPELELETTALKPR